MMLSRLKPARRQRGFSLVEGLVSMVIISVGMLGIAGLYTQTLQSGRAALLRTKAIVLATDLADRMRTNEAGAQFYTAGAAAANQCNDTTLAQAAVCTPQQMAQQDLWEWFAALASPATGLPAGAGTITVNNGTTPPTYTITVSWQDRDEASSYVTTIQL